METLMEAVKITTQSRSVYKLYKLHTYGEIYALRLPTSEVVPVLDIYTLQVGEPFRAAFFGYSNMEKLVDDTATPHHTRIVTSPVVNIQNI